MLRSIAAAMLVGVLLWATVSFARSGMQRPAPAVSTLPLVSRAHVIASAAGGSAVDSASDPKRYRYLAISERSRTSSRRLLIDQVQFLRRVGWRHLYVYHCVWRRKLERAVCLRTSLKTPGASALLDAPTGREYVALDAVTSQKEAVQEEDGTPLSGNHAIRATLRRGQPVLFGSLGNGRHR
jgi:hypothetical protein